MQNNKNRLPSIQPYNEVVKGAGIILIGTIVGILFNYTFKIVMGRYYGPSAYGMFSLGTAVLITCASISLLGLDIGIARFIPLFRAKKNYEKLKGGLIFGAKIIIITSIIFASLIYINATWISTHIFKNQNLISIIKIFAITIPILSVFNYILGIFRGMKSMKNIIIHDNILNLLLRLMILLGLIIFGFSIYYTPYSYLIPLIFVTVLAILVIRKSKLYSSIKKVRAKSASGEMVSFSLPLAGSLIVDIFRQRADILLIGFFLSTQEVGFYSAALPIAILLPSFLYATNRIIMPVATDLHGKNKLKEIELIYKNIARWATTITLPLFFFFFFFPELILRTLFGAQFLPAALPLMILSVGMFINVLSGSVGELLNVFGKTKFILVISIIGALLNISLMLLLIPRLGITGAALSLAFSSLVIELMALLYLKIKKNIHPFSSQYLKTFVVGLFLFISVFYITKNYIVVENIIMIGIISLLTFICYLFILNKMNVFPPEDKEILTAVKNKLFYSIQNQQKRG
ncbi:flippase [Patescibacteria group bacterium AH-259-L05]|nr:flippase [Patescibacteria group bacterium AH-259-L05]